MSDDEEVVAVCHRCAQEFSESDLEFWELCPRCGTLIERDIEKPKRRETMNEEKLIIEKPMTEEEELAEVEKIKELVKNFKVPGQSPSDNELDEQLGEHEAEIEEMTILEKHMMKPIVVQEEFAEEELIHQDEVFMKKYMKPKFVVEKVHGKNILEKNNDNQK